MKRTIKKFRASAPNIKMVKVRFIKTSREGTVITRIRIPVNI